MSKKELLLNMFIFLAPVVVGIFSISLIPLLRQGGSKHVVFSILVVIISLIVLGLTRLEIAYWQMRAGRNITTAIQVSCCFLIIASIAVIVFGRKLGLP